MSFVLTSMMQVSGFLQRRELLTCLPLLVFVTQAGVCEKEC